MTAKLISTMLLLFSTSALGSDPVYYTGENVEICNPPSEIIHRPEISGGPYFLNYGKDKSSSYLTVVIWERDISNLEINPYTYFQIDNACVRGEVTLYKERKQIIIRDSSQIFVSKNK